MDRQNFKKDLKILAEQNKEWFPDGRKLVNKLANLVTKINTMLSNDENADQIIGAFSDGLFESATLFFKEAQLDKDKARRNLLSRFVRLAEFSLDVKVVGANKSRPTTGTVLQRRDFVVDSLANLNKQQLKLKLTSFMNDSFIINNSVTNDPALRGQLKIFTEKGFTDFKFEKLSKQNGFLKNIQYLTRYLVLLKQVAQLSLDVDFVAAQDEERRKEIGNTGPSSGTQNEDYIKKIHEKYTSLKIREIRSFVDKDKKLNTNWRGTKLIKEDAADEFLKNAEGKQKAKKEKDPEEKSEPANKYDLMYKKVNEQISGALYNFLALQERAYVFWTVAHGFNALLDYASIVRKKLLDDLDGNLAEAQKYAEQIRELNFAFDDLRNTIGKTIVKAELNFTNDTNTQFKKIDQFIQNNNDQHSDAFVNSLKLIEKLDFFEVGSDMLVFLNGLISKNGEQFITRAVKGLNIIATKERSSVKKFENPTQYLFNKIRQDILSRALIVAIPKVADTAGGADSSIVLDDIAKGFVYDIHEYVNKDRDFKLRFEQYVARFYEQTQGLIDSSREQWVGILRMTGFLNKWADSVQVNNLEETGAQSTIWYTVALNSFVDLLPKIKQITEVTLRVFGTGFVKKVLKKKEDEEENIEISDIYFNSIIEKQFTGELRKILNSYLKCKKLYKNIYKINKGYNEQNLSIVRRVELTKEFTTLVNELSVEMETNFYGVFDASLKKVIEDSMKGFGKSIEDSSSGLVLLEDSIKSFVDQIKETFDGVKAFEDKTGSQKLSGHYKELFFKRIPFVQAIHSIERGEDIRNDFLVFMRRVVVLIILESYYPGVNFGKIGSMSEFDNSTVVETLKGVCTIYNLDYDAFMKKGMVSDENFETASGFKKVITNFLDFFINMALSKDAEDKKRSIEDDTAAYNAVVEITNNLLNITEEDKIIAARNAEKIFIAKVKGKDKAKEFIQTTKGNIKPRDFIKGILESILKTYENVVKDELLKFRKRLQKGVNKTKKEGKDGN